MLWKWMNEINTMRHHKNISPVAVSIATFQRIVLASTKSKAER
jgi:hypothetical protein